MARLNKLLIHGVRSFGDGDHEEQIITFNTPLTLILGQNGCGKTTIIESLKVACCGEYPPGSVGGRLFVHDPKCNNKLETKGHIKLKIFDVDNKPIEVDRHFKVVQKTANMKFSTTEQSIKRILADGQAPVVSGQCAEVNNEMCEALGVSKAILNYVIFCHQEDADWPLDEGKKVKERFDEIFDSTKYNKCLDVLDKQKKVMGSDNKVLERDVSNLKERKENVIQMRERKEALTRQVAENRAKVDALLAKLEPIHEQLKDIATRENNISEINRDFIEKEAALKHLSQELLNLRKLIKTEFNGTTDELRASMESFDTELRDKQRSLTKLEERLQTLSREESGINTRVDVEQRKVGQLQAKEELNKKRIDDRNLNLNRLARDLDIAGSEATQTNETQVAGLLAQVKERVTEQTNELEMYRIQLDAEETHLEANVEQCRDTKVKLDAEISSTRKELMSKKDEVRKVRDDIADVDKSAGTLARIEARLDRAQRELDDAARTVDVDALKRAMEDSVKSRKTLEDRLDGVSKEVRILTQRASDMAELDAKRKARDVADADARKLRNRHNDSLTHLLGTLPEEGFRYELQACQDKLIREIKQLTNQLGDKQTEVTKFEANRKHQKELLQSKEEELRVNEEKIYKSCGLEPYDEVVKSLSETINTLQDQVGTLSASGTLYRRYIKKLLEPDPCCPLCSRGFPSNTESKELVAELQNKLREFPTRLAESKDKLATMSQKYDSLQQLKTIHANTATLKLTEIPKIRSDLTALELKLSSSQRQVEDLEMSRCVPQSDLDSLQSLQGDIVLLDKHQAEVKRLEREIEHNESQLPPGASGRSMTQALAEQEKLSADVDTARRQAETAQHQLTSHSDRMQTLREEKNKLTADMLKIKGDVASRQQLSDRLTELQNLEVSLSNALDKLNTQVPAAKARLADATREREQARKDNRDKMDKGRKELSRLENRLQEVTGWQKDIDNYELHGGNAQLVQVRSDLAKLQCDREKVHQEKEDQAGLIASVQTEIASQQTRKRELGDNMRLRKMQSEKVSQTAEVEVLRGRMGTLDYKSILREKKRLQQEEEAVNREKHMADGRRYTLEENLTGINLDLNKPTYKSAEADYCKALAELAVKTAACADLHRFAMALEHALIRFHQEKMKVVNTTIRELWRTIYRGNDIDYIEVKTDSSEKSSVKRRSYNYRVVQKRGNAELDMRGRCSAGQKVLACLIIRLALSETFSSSCGIIALDEPTTNLDQINMSSLSVALADLVSQRLNQKNFQLLIITHDEEFLKTLCLNETVETYYKVERNANGKSIIKRNKVSRL